MALKPVKKITRRWLFNSFGVIVIIILVVECVCIFGVSTYYYSTVRQTLRNQAELVNSVFGQYYAESASTGVSLYSRMVDYVVVFPSRERMELMTIDAEGSIGLTSSGFLPDADPLEDYRQALSSPDGQGEYVGEMNGQRVMAISTLSPMGDSSLSAVRFVVSLERVDRQIVFWVVCMVTLGAAILFMVLFSSSYFISSIVNPVGEVGETARRIAGGDFGARLQKRTNDEIGDLCDTINYMAEKLGETEQMKNDFISSVSHELRTPLTAIQGWGETILDDNGKDPETLRRGMGIIISETARLSRMVEELLDFSRMQSGRLQMEMDRMDALAELSDVVLMYTDRAKREDKTLTMDDGELIVPVMGDRNRLRQVFVNLIDNAVKYTDPGDSIRVTAGCDGKNLTIVISDTGIGIGPEDLPRVKTRFYKVNTTRRSSGIGLAVADEIIERHGGTLTVDSALGEGTTITVTLPVYKPE